MADYLKILQVNTRSVKANILLLETLLISEDIDIGILCETWLKPNEVFRIKNYNIFMNNRDDGYGGVAIITKQKLNANKINIEFNHIEAIEVKISIKNISYSFISVYIPPNISNSSLQNSFNQFITNYENRSKVYIGGDFNARHSLWELNGKGNSRGKLLANEINNSNLYLLNNGQHTYQHIFKNVFSAIDLSLISNDLRNNVNWKVSEDNVGSDHLPIICEIGRKDSLPKTITVEKIDYKKLELILDRSVFNEATDIDMFEEQLENKIKECKNSIKIRTKYTPKPWWTNKIQNLWMIKRFKQRIYFQNRTLYSAIELKKSCAKLKREIKIEKEKTWNEFIEELNPRSTLKSVYKKIQIFNPLKNKKCSNNSFLDSNNKLNQLLNHNYTQINFHSNFDYLKEINNDKIEETEIIKIIDNNKNTAPGENEISNKILKMLNKDNVKILTKLLEKMWNNQDFPSAWSRTKAVTFKKPGKDENLFQNYRIICLLNVIYKVFNKYIKTKLNNIIENRHLIPENSFGFRAKNSINEFAVRLVQTVERNKIDNNITAIISIDLEKAFDNIDVTILVVELTNMGFDNKYIFWIAKMLTNRKLRLKHKDHQAEICISRGIPQGDVISPLLFNLYTAKIHQLQSQDITVLQYADDFAFLIRDRNSSDLNLKVNRLMCNFTILLNTLNFKINTSKTKYMCNNNSIFTPLIISINNDIIKEELDLKILGIIIDNKLNFVKHFKETKEKCLKYSNVLKIFNNKKNGAHPKTLLNAYKSLVKSRATYGAVATNLTNNKALTVTQTTLNASLRAAMNLTRSTPVTAILAESGEWPFEYSKELINIKFICKHIYSNTTFGNDILKADCTDSINKTFTNNPILKLLPKQIHFDIKPSNLFIYHFIYDYKKSNDRKDNLKIVKKEISLNSNKDAVYTDASIMEGKVGIGIYIEETEEQIAHTIRHMISIKSAEIFAIFMAINYMITMGKRDIVVFTDSKSSCVSLINTMKDNNDKYYEQKIIKLANSNPDCRFTIQWVPAHIGVKGNEIVDSIAKKAITNQNINVEIKLSPNDVIMNCKISLHEKWTNEYMHRTLTKGKFNAKVNTNNPSRKPWFYKSKMSHKHIKLINRLRTGHTYDKTFKHLMKLEDNNICNTCNVQENSSHIIDTCTQYNTNRQQYTNICKKGLLNILKDAKENELQEIANFVDEIGQHF